MKVSFAELHNPLFLAGKNHGQKLFAKSGMELNYSREDKELAVTYNGKTAYLPSTSVHSYEVSGPGPKDEKPPIVHGKIRAQVSTPQDHVFAADGGKTRN